ncbi:hypothetical protein [Nocardioides sp. WS12]|uniref:hypothetical protein n=1 Tax=Nocardioides sp. WS12 TaxID=2486272 RepID=UPI0015F8E1EE|nr:hypothetical protein [Nocardioides sp. WS12]
MVNDIREIMREAVASPPAEGDALADVLRSGRRRVRRRRTGVVAGALVLAAVVTVGIGWRPGGKDGDQVANRTVPQAQGPVLRIGDATAAVEGTDYDVLSSYTNKDLNAANGQYYDGVTDDGLILFRDGPHGVDNTERLALLDPVTEKKTWLPDLADDQQMIPLELGAERLVFASLGFTSDGDPGVLTMHVLDRARMQWATITWPSLPAGAEPFGGEVGPDGRLYVGVRATEGSPPPGGWPTGPDGEADDAAAKGDTFDLWSVSLTDAGDVRDEGLRVGAFAFTDDALVWSTTTNGINDRIHVRDLATGAEHDFDPKSGERCNLLGFGATGDRIVLSQYCGTYDDGRDDRIQVLSTDGDLVTTIQGDGIEGWIADNGSRDGHLVLVRSHTATTEGQYVYDLDTGGWKRVSDSVSSWALGGSAPSGQLLWDTAYGDGKGDLGQDQGATQWLVRWR